MQRQEQKHDRLLPLEVFASVLCMLYGLGSLYVAHVLEDMGLRQAYVRMAQGVGIGFFLVALVGLLRLRTITLACQVLLAIAWLGLIPMGYTLDQDMGAEGHLFTLWAAGIGVCLAALHLFLAWHFRRQTQE
ncbi:hypothetical protein [Armatimonas rosea]|uniref:Putative integral membrane protein n=1 Tax=Armatimonas rosea TaxID=685828 RepID=A0A7W9W6K9_ARMRO|nr:hypothetical protein [Armatimonas rosea]MBB6050688.1 putative integral membrane protein [Armatimonas rosea]